MLKTSISEGIQELGLDYTDTQITQLERFLELLLKWNKTYNLTSITKPDEIVLKHLLDSLTILPYIKTYTGEVKNVLDVGCGAGFPSIPCAIFSPLIKYYLIDAVSKKITFVRQAAIELGLKNLAAYNERVEDIELKVNFNVIVSRAFSSIPDFISLTYPHLNKGGYWLAMKGKIPEDEIKSLPSSTALEQIIKLKVPGLKEDRHLIVIKKI